MHLKTIDLSHVYIFCRELMHAQRLAGKNVNATSRQAKIQKYLVVSERCLISKEKIIFQL